MFYEQQFYFLGQIQTSQTGGHPYSDTRRVSVLWRIHLCPSVIFETFNGKPNQCSGTEKVVALGWLVK